MPSSIAHRPALPISHTSPHCLKHSALRTLSLHFYPHAGHAFRCLTAFASLSVCSILLISAEITHCLDQEVFPKPMSSRDQPKCPIRMPGLDSSSQRIIYDNDIREFYAFYTTILKCFQESKAMKFCFPSIQHRAVHIVFMKSLLVELNYLGEYHKSL